MKRIWNGILPILGMLVPLAIPHVAASGPYAPTVQLSWDQCDPIVRNRNFSEPGIYTIVLVGTQFDTPVLGTEAEIQFRGTTGVPDAWRFEEGGAAI